MIGEWRVEFQVWNKDCEEEKGQCVVNCTRVGSGGWRWQWGFVSPNPHEGTSQHWDWLAWASALFLLLWKVGPTRIIHLFILCVFCPLFLFTYLLAGHAPSTIAPIHIVITYIILIIIIKNTIFTLSYIYIYAINLWN